jgi:diamine N-acetyltransferase
MIAARACSMLGHGMPCPGRNPPFKEPSVPDQPLEPPIINFEGDLVALGPIRRDLIPTYQRWINDFSAVRTLGVPPVPMTLERETAWFDGAASGDTIIFTVYERASGRPIGNVDLRDIDRHHRTAEFGILIGEPDARGKGYGTEATRLTLDYAFTALGLNNVMLRVFAYNPAAIAAYRKAGFREFGRQREARWYAGRRWDVIFMDCLAGEFESPVLGRVFVPDEPRS